MKQKNMTTEEKTRFMECKIINLINTYGAKRFAHGMIKWYGYRSLVYDGDLAGIEDEIKEIKED